MQQPLSLWRDAGDPGGSEGICCTGGSWSERRRSAEGHAKGRFQRVIPWQAQACRLGRRLPFAPSGIVLKGDCPGQMGWRENWSSPRYTGLSPALGTVRRQPAADRPALAALLVVAIPRFDELRFEWHDGYDLARPQGRSGWFGNIWYCFCCAPRWFGQLIVSEQ